MSMMIIYKIILFLLMVLQLIFKVNLNIFKGNANEDILHHEVVIPWRVNQSGHFLSYVIPCYNQTICGNCSCGKVICYKLKIKNEEVHIELTPNFDLLSNVSLKEEYNNRNKRTNDKMSRLKKLAFGHCQHRGIVKYNTNSSVALSNCGGLMGYIKLNDEFYIIEPLKQNENNIENGQIHSIYQYYYSPYRVNDHQTSSRSARMRKRRYFKQRSVSDPGYTKQLYLETLVVIDKTLIDFHKSLDLNNYVLTIMNMAHTLFRDNTFGAPLELVIVRMISLEQEDEAMNIEITKNPPKVLEAFQAWAKTINPALDSHPHHHDVAILITRVDLCLNRDISGCGLMGLANLASVCNSEQQAVIVEDSGLVAGFTVAHEIGHALGMEHDGLDESGCKSSPYENGYSVVMAKQVSMRMRGWSSCSREYLWAFIDAGLAWCLYDEPAGREMTEDLLPGTMYGVSFQCQSLIDHTVEACPDVGVDCNNMKCWVPEYGCVETRRPLADGTECGPHMWCFAGQCLTAGQRPKARDGGWTNWSEWSDCSSSCGSGVRHVSRTCDNPRPENRGLYCKGQRIKYEICNSQACPFNSESFRDVQCAEFNDWIYPEDNSTHSWINHVATSESPCALVCQNEKKHLVLLKSVVTDGTPCYFSPGHVCIGGQCKTVTCDGALDSGTVEDACGVCGGPGTSCQLRTKYETITKHAKPQQVVTVPINAHFATFEELSPTKATFIVKLGSMTILSGNKFGTTPVGKMSVWLGYVRHQQELLKIFGPVIEPLEVYVHTSEEVTIKYTIAEHRTDHHKGSYRWQHAEWTECSAECGLGTHSSIAECIEVMNGLVDNKYCSEIQKPETLTRPCELRKCEPRWQVGEWSGCDCNCPTDTVDERAVLCIMSTLNGQDDHVVSDNKCPLPKPQFMKHCNCQSHSLSRSSRQIEANSIREKIKAWLPQVKVKSKNKNKIKTVSHKMSKTNLNFPNQANCLCPTSKNVDRNHMKNIKFIEKQKGQLIQDFENLNELELTLEIDDEQANQNLEYNKGFPKLHRNDQKVSVHGKQAVKIIQQLQEQHHTTSHNGQIS